jgi:hypothetical protein
MGVRTLPAWGGDLPENLTYKPLNYGAMTFQPMKRRDAGRAASSTLKSGTSMAASTDG